MMVEQRKFESILPSIDRAIAPLYLTSTQEIVLKATWEGKTYSQIAYENNYDSEYIKSVGCSLWQLLSNAFQEQINKSNFVPFIRQQAIGQEHLQISENQAALQKLPEQKQYFYWSTAPHIKNFIGREKEIKTLTQWIQEPECRCIIVSGMVGCGKTTLVTKFARESKKKFDYVIWFSLYQTPSLTTLLKQYLKLINQNSTEQPSVESADLSFMIPEFIECLKKKKILLILDGLQNILYANQVKVIYKQQFEEYGQLLRAIITTNHNSLLITTSRIKPTMLEYYAKNQVKFLNLQGLDFKATKNLLDLEKKNLFAERDILPLSISLQSNPQLLKIVVNHINSFSIDNTEQVLNDLSLLEGIVNLLEQELNHLSNFNQEIVYWLAISCFPLSLEDLWKNIQQSQPKIKFLYSIDCLIKRSLIIKHNNAYSLMPVMKNYLRRKLVREAIHHQKLLGNN